MLAPGRGATPLAGADGEMKAQVTVHQMPVRLFTHGEDAGGHSSGPTRNALARRWLRHH